MDRDFAKWCASASVAERCRAVESLAEASDADACPPGWLEREDVLLALAGDPSPKVRTALARRLAPERTAPRRIVRILCDDVDAVAVPLVRRSLSLDDDDLVDFVVTGSAKIRCAIAGRARLGARVSAALACLGERAVVLELLENDGACLTPSVIRTIVERHGGEGVVRDTLLQRGDLPADLRQTLLLETGGAIGGMELVRAVLGEAASRRIVSEACEAGTATIAETVEPREMAPFVEHLRASGQITTAFLLRAACGGHIDLFAAALSGLTRLSFARVRSVLVDARDPAFSALCAAAGLPGPVVPLLLSAVRKWKAVSRHGIEPGYETAALVLDQLADELRVSGEEEDEKLRTLLTRLSLQAARSAAARQASARLAA